MYVDAVEACVSAKALRKPRPGNAAIHGGAKVTRLSTVARSRAATCCHESPLTTRQTAP
jgi:hypothetical protein